MTANGFATAGLVLDLIRHMAGRVFWRTRPTKRPTLYNGFANYSTRAMQYSFENVTRCA